MTALEIKDYIKKEIIAIDKQNHATLFEIRNILNQFFGESNVQLIKLNTSSYENSIFNGISESQYKNEAAISCRIRDIINNYSCYEVILRFPEVLLTSENKLKHKLYNLFVRFNFTGNLKICGYFSGMRTSHTVEEILSDYSHSHLPGLSEKFETFCTGTGPINQTLAILKNEYDSINFQLFCLHINNYVKYESISGTPYRYIQNINNNNQSLSTSNIYISTIDSRYLEILMGKIISNLSSQNILKCLHININELRISIELNEVGEKLLLDSITSINDHALRNLSRSCMNHLTGVRTPNKEYYVIQQQATLQSSRTRKVLLEFKKEKFYNEIISKDNEELQLSTEIFPNPKITEYVNKELSRIFTRKAFSINPE